ncbi:MAG: hypothetical protein R3302_09450 [Sulfurimonadaceae bacterium]|nr:hypothetical protein [Sulfurimonadaceae bacterium]
MERRTHKERYRFRRVFEEVVGNWFDGHIIPMGAQATVYMALYG